MTQKTKQTQLIKSAFRELMKGVYTSIPGHVLAFDPVTQWAQVQIGVERVDINGAVFTPPPIINVPVSFTGDDWVLEHQIDPGCEGNILFSQRCIDGWQQTGGVAVNPLGRFHDMQDAIFVPGIRSLPNVVTDFANDGMRLRDKAGTQFVWLKGDGTIDVRNPSCNVTLSPDGTIESRNSSCNVTLSPDGTVSTQNGSGYIILGADGTVTINGVTIDPSGNITSPATIKGSEVVFGGVSGTTHRHTDVSTGIGTSGGPI